MEKPIRPLATKGLVTVFGGSGFVGRRALQAMARAGWRLRVATRRPDLGYRLRLLGGLGQIVHIQANLRYPASIERAMEGADAVVNLVGVLAESGRQSFSALHAEGAGRVAEFARAAGAKRLVQVSAIGADAGSDIGYLRSKGEGEARVRAAFPDATILRPSIVFGPEDRFFNRFAGMARLAPALPLIGGDTRFQPVYVGDVAAAVGKAVDGAARPGTTYELGGPEVLSFRACMERMLAVTGRRRTLLPIPFALARPLGRLAGYLPGAPLTADQVRMLEQDNVVSEAAKAEGRTLEGLGITPTALDVILPTYLVQYREQGQFTRPKLDDTAA